MQIRSLYFAASQKSTGIKVDKNKKEDWSTAKEAGDMSTYVGKYASETKKQLENAQKRKENRHLIEDRYVSSVDKKRYPLGWPPNKQ